MIFRICPGTTAYDDQQTPDFDDGRLQTVHCVECCAAIPCAAGQHRDDLRRVPLSDGTCAQRAGPAHRTSVHSRCADRALFLHARRGVGQLQRQLHRQKNAARRHL